jgi:hypothetical protein
MHDGTGMAGPIVLLMMGNYFFFVGVLGGA